MLNRNVFVQLFIGVIFSQLLITNAHEGGGAPGGSKPPSGNERISNKPRRSSNAPADCPPGLEPLSRTNGISLSKKRDERGWNTRTTVIKNAAGREIYYATEKYAPLSSILMPRLAFNMSIFDHRKVEVLYSVKADNWTSTYLDVFLGLPGCDIIGKVKGHPSFVNQELEIMNPSNEVILYINSTSLPLPGGYLKLKIFLKDGKEVGQIKKYNPNLWQISEDFVNVTLSLLEDLDVRVKATLLAACLFLTEN